MAEIRRTGEPRGQGEGVGIGFGRAIRTGKGGGCNVGCGVSAERPSDDELCERCVAQALHRVGEQSLQVANDRISRVLPVRGALGAATFARRAVVH